jgi:predicted secreted Zn-dependent protease
MMKALQTHEEGHAEIARNWAPVIHERLLGKPKKKIGALYRKAMLEVKKAQRTYDNKTKHGINQGVSLDITIQ